MEVFELSELLVFEVEVLQLHEVLSPVLFVYLRDLIQFVLKGVEVQLLILLFGATVHSALLELAEQLVARLHLVLEDQ